MPRCCICSPLVKIKDAIDNCRLDKGLLVVLFVFSLWSVLVFNKIAPVQEGWYEVYSDMILSGKKPYVDYELLYFPTYTYFFSMIVAIFGPKLIVMRVVGAVIFVTTGVLIYKICSLILPKWIAIMSSIVGLFYSIIDEFYCSYDIHELTFLFFLASLYLLLRGILTEGQLGKLASFLFSGIFCSMVIFLKPQCGLIYMSAVILLTILYKLFSNRKFVVDWRLFLIGLLIPAVLFVALLAAYGMLVPFYNSAFNYSAKGDSFISILFTFTKSFATPLFSILIISVILCVDYCRRREDAVANDSKKNAVLITISVVAILLSVFFIQAISNAFTIPYGFTRRVACTVALMGIILLTTLLFRMIYYRRDASFDNTRSLLVLTCVIGSLAMIWGAGTSGQICALFEPLLLASLIGFALVEFNHYVKYKKVMVIITVFVALLLLTTSVSLKTTNPYRWWGQAEAPYYDCTYTSEYDYFDGIYMSYENKEMYDDFKKQAELYLTDGDEMYCYSNNQVFYHLAGIVPTVYSPICFFDVSSEDAIKKDVQYLRDNHPKMIVFEDSGTSAIEYSEGEYGDKSGHWELYYWLCWCRDDPGSGYSIVSTYHGNMYVLIRE